MALIASRFLFRLLGIAVGEGSKLSPVAVRTARAPGITIGSGSIINCRFAKDRPDARIAIGDRCYIGKSLIVSAESVKIEDDAIISWGVTIVDHNSHAIEWSKRANDVADWHANCKDWSAVPISPVTIGKRCWIGFNASILKGVSLGEGAIVGAGSVVTKDVPPFTVVAGNPAVVVRKLDTQ